jgi:hypothetical protein
MASTLTITHVRIRTVKGWQEPYALDRPVVVLWGPVDTGKTSFVEAIAYVLGKDVRFHGVVDKHLRAVEIGVRIGTVKYTMTRVRKSQSVVTVLDATGTLEGRFPLKKRGDERSFSSWLLGELGLDDALSAVRTPLSRSGLTFASGLLPFCYLTQGDIDRQIIMPSGADSTRIPVFKLLTGVTTPPVERVDGEIAEEENLIRRLRTVATDLGAFLDKDPATNAGTLGLQIDALTEQREAALARMKASRDPSIAVHLQTAHFDRLMEEAKRSWRDAEDEAYTAGLAHLKARKNVENLEQSLAELTELEERQPWRQGTILAVVSHCQFCGGKVPREEFGPGQCFMCGGPRRGVVQPGERASLEHALAEARKILAEAEPADRAAIAAAEQAKAQIAQVQQLFDERTRFPAPASGAFEDAARQVGEIDGQLKELQRARAAAARVAGLWEEIQIREKALAERKTEHLAAARHLADNPDLVPTLNDIFIRVLGRIAPPNWTGRARIDPATYLPEVDGLAFERRGGGARSTVAIAYSLTLLTYALENQDCALPSLLIIDSPRKNFGASASDRGLSDRVYEQILEYLEIWSGARTGSRRPPFQIIIVDNDLNDDTRKARARKHRDHILYHHLDTGNGFIRDLDNPHAVFVDDNNQPAMFDDTSDE